MTALFCVGIFGGGDTLQGFRQGGWADLNGCLPHFINVTETILLRSKHVKQCEKK
jgi:hypothetical protein